MVAIVFDVPEIAYVEEADDNLYSTLFLFNSEEYVSNWAHYWHMN